MSAHLASYHEADSQAHGVRRLDGSTGVICPVARHRTWTGSGRRLSYVGAAARSHAWVSGYVRNLADGPVEVVGEGPRETLEQFLAVLASWTGKRRHTICPGKLDDARQ